MPVLKASGRVELIPPVGTVGQDVFGDILVERIAGEGVDTSRVRRSGKLASGMALIVVEEGTGLSTIVVDPGANMDMVPGDLDVFEPEYQGAQVALFQLEIPLEVVLEGARRSRRMGLITVLDAGPPRGVDPALLSCFDVVSPNLDELGALTGRVVDSTEGAVRAAGILLDAGVRMAVIKMGSAGALLALPGDTWHLPAIPVKAVDATGAGDAFTAALAVSLAGGAAPLEAVSFAVAAGALAVTVAGALPSMPRRAGVESLLKEVDIRCLPR